MKIPDVDSASTLVTWQDARCSEEFLQSLPSSPHGKPSTGFGCASLIWYSMNNARLLKEYTHAGTIMDFIVAYLTGSVVMSSQNAASWGYFDAEKLKWERDM